MELLAGPAFGACAQVAGGPVISRAPASCHFVCCNFELPNTHVSFPIAVAYRDPRGYYYIVDRKKELIKVSGLQVAPAELEGLLLQHPGVMDCAVVQRPDERTGERPVAFVVRATPRLGNAPGEQGWMEPTGADIIEWAAARTAPHKKIADVHFVQSIPKSVSGKILRRLLRDELKKAGGPV